MKASGYFSNLSFKNKINSLKISNSPSLLGLLKKNDLNL